MVLPDLINLDFPVDKIFDNCHVFADINVIYLSTQSGLFSHRDHLLAVVPCFSLISFFRSSQSNRTISQLPSSSFTPVNSGGEVMGQSASQLAKGPQGPRV